MDIRGRARHHERGSNWTDPEIVELLQLWSEESVQLELESSLRNQRVFDRIARVLREKGIQRSGDQCREKIKKMKLEYRRIKDNHKTRSWKFYGVMDRVLANRPAITYSALGGAVVAQQVFQGAGGAQAAYLQGAPPPSTFGPASSGGFLFGQPLGGEDSLDIKCEEVEEGAAPAVFYGSGNEQETEGQSFLGAEDALAPPESSTMARVSSSGSSEVTAAASLLAPTPQQPQKQAYVKQRKRRRGGKTSSGSLDSGESLDKALASFLSWQQSAEERLLSLEEARLERELEAEERREQREERRAEQERRHELQLLGMLTSALLAGRQDPHAAVPAPAQPPTGASAGDAVSAPEANKSPAARRGSQDALVAPSEAAARSGHLSDRGNSIRQQRGILQEGFIQYAADKHHDTDNPDGIVNLGTSENKLCFDLLKARLTRPDMLRIEPSLLQYSDWTGHTFLREEVAGFLTHYCCSPKPLKADNVVVMNGCGSLFSCVAAVICDPTDVILIPTPFYGVITEDLHLYSGVKLFHVPLDCESLQADGRESKSFHLTVTKLEEGLRRAKQDGLNVRGIILMNPHNPLAEIYTLKEMTAFLEFAKKNELHAIVDEVYMLTVFDESVTFRSVLRLESLPDPQRTHVMWGMSKDFAMAGIRVGTLYTENRDLVEALAQLGSFHGLPGSVQHQAAQLLRDREWIDHEFLPENKRRLKLCHTLLTKELRSLNIPFLNTSAALYVWADLRKYLKESSFEEELSLWRCFLRHKVLLSCGQAFSCSTPGWFRIVFADQQNQLRLGLTRIREALREAEERVSSKGTAERSHVAVKEERVESDNATIVNSTSSPRRKSADCLADGDSPAPDTSELAADELVLLDCQASKPAEGLESLLGTLRHQIRSSDWLEKNTPELSPGEDPQILDVFKALLQRAAK